MINYSDVLVDKGERPVITFYSDKSIKTGTPFKVLKGKEILFSGKTEGYETSIELDSFTEDFVELTVEIETPKSFHFFPVTIMRLDRERPYIICDIDFTVSATSLYGYITNNLLHMKMVLNSSEILQNLAQTYKIIYLTGRHHRYTKLTKMWIKKNEFPDGPMIARKNETSLQLKQYKQNALQKMVSINPNGIGIGDLKSDVDAYLYHSLFAIKIRHPIFFKNNTSYFKQQENYYEVKSWLGIEKLFKDILIQRSF